MRVGFIGLGNIGGAVAANLVADGHEVTVQDVDAVRAGAVGGADPVATAAEVARATEMTILSLPTPAIVESVAAEWAGAAEAGSVLVDLSTNDPAAVRRLGERLAVAGHDLVESPLTGGHIGAEQRLLMFMVGGGDGPVARVRPVLEPLGRALFHVGPLGQGNTMKLINSLVAYTATWSSLEALSLAAKSGIGVRTAVEVLRTGGAGNFYLDRMVEGIDERGRPARFALDLAAKDAALVVGLGRSLGVPTPAGEAVLEVLKQAVEDGLGPADWSDLVVAAERQGDVELRWSTDV